MLRILGHLACWNGLYAVAALVCLHQLLNFDAGPLPRWEAFVAVFATASAVYILDRIKLRDAWIDPSDLASQPDRYKFLTRHTLVIRGSAMALLLIGALVGSRVTLWALAVPPAAVGGIGLYAPRPRRASPRIKDVLWLKNSYVAVGMTVYLSAVIIMLPHAGERPYAPAFWAGTAWLLARIVLDAALCDFDDEAADKQFGTSTLAIRVGRARALGITLAGRAMLIVTMLANVLWPWRVRVAWIAALSLGTLMLRVPRWARLRDLVDVRFAGEALVATSILMLWQENPWHADR